MNKNIAKLLLAFVAILLPKEMVSQANTFNCRVYEENNILQANCANIPRLTGVPQDIDPRIKRLDLSSNTLRNISENQFNRYADLEMLTMINVNSSFNNSYYYLFRPLKKLTSLHLDYGTWNWMPPLARRQVSADGDVVFYWPPSLKNLTVRYCAVWFLDLSNLRYLEYLDARENPINTFPIFHKFAPLKHVNLSLTFLLRMRAEDLAPLCFLEQLDASVSSNDAVFPEILYPEKQCECLRLHSWANQTGIKGRLPECSRIRTEICDLSFSEDLLSVRRACQSGMSRSHYVFPVLLIVLIIVVIAVVAVAACLGVYFYTKKKKSKNNDSNVVE